MGSASLLQSKGICSLCACVCTWEKALDYSGQHSKGPYHLQYSGQHSKGPYHLQYSGQHSKGPYHLQYSGHIAKVPTICSTVVNIAKVTTICSAVVKWSIALPEQLEQYLNDLFPSCFGLQRVSLSLSNMAISSYTTPTWLRLARSGMICT